MKKILTAAVMAMVCMAGPSAMAHDWTPPDLTDLEHVILDAALDAALAAVEEAVTVQEVAQSALSAAVDAGLSADLQAVAQGYIDSSPIVEIPK